jgi:hypothetical protein
VDVLAKRDDCRFRLITYGADQSGYPLHTQFLARKEPTLPDYKGVFVALLMNNDRLLEADFLDATGKLVKTLMLACLADIGSTDLYAGYRKLFVPEFACHQLVPSFAWE